MRLRQKGESFRVKIDGRPSAAPWPGSYVYFYEISVSNESQISSFLSLLSFDMVFLLCLSRVKMQMMCQTFSCAGKSWNLPESSLQGRPWKSVQISDFFALI